MVGSALVNGGELRLGLALNRARLSLSDHIGLADVKQATNSMFASSDHPAFGHPLLERLDGEWLGLIVPIHQHDLIERNALTAKAVDQGFVLLLKRVANPGNRCSILRCSTLSLQRLKNSADDLSELNFVQCVGHWSNSVVCRASPYAGPSQEFRTGYRADLPIWTDCRPGFGVMRARARPDQFSQTGSGTRRV